MKIIKYLLWLFFPSRCACCNRLLKRDEQICAECNAGIERIKKICTVCGCEKDACECHQRVFRFSGAVAPFNYGRYSKAAVYNYKFHNNIEIADFLADNMAESVRHSFGDIVFDAVTSVPMHPLKRFKNGYNQSEVLSKKIASRLSLPYSNCLKKVKKNNTQHRLPLKERAGNVKGAFTAENISAKTVLLVDDIKTTGATLDECTKELLFAGAEKVYCVTAISNNYKKQQLKND